MLPPACRELVPGQSWKETRLENISNLPNRCHAILPTRQDLMTVEHLYYPLPRRGYQVLETRLSGLGIEEKETC
jgi:hypothetical protein